MRHTHTHHTRHQVYYTAPGARSTCSPAILLPNHAPASIAPSTILWPPPAAQHNAGCCIKLTYPAAALLLPQSSSSYPVLSAGSCHAPSPLWDIAFKASAKACSHGTPQQSAKQHSKGDFSAVTCRPCIQKQLHTSTQPREAGCCLILLTPDRVRAQALHPLQR